MQQSKALQRSCSRLYSRHTRPDDTVVMPTSLSSARTRTAPRQRDLQLTSTPQRGQESGAAASKTDESGTSSRNLAQSSTVRRDKKSSAASKRYSKLTAYSGEKNHIGAERRRLLGCHPLRTSVKWRPHHQRGGFRHHLVFLLLSCRAGPASCVSACSKFGRARPGAVAGWRRQYSSQRPRLNCRWLQ